jgi:hypothetical protein
LEQKAAAEPAPSDWVYVNNFLDPYKPRAIFLPPGRGAEFRADMQSLVAHLQTDMPRAFEAEEYVQARTQIGRDLEEARDNEFARLSEVAQSRGFALGQRRRPVIAPIINGQPADPDAIAGARPTAAATRSHAPDLEDALADALRVVRERDKEPKPNCSTWTKSGEL